MFFVKENKSYFITSAIGLIIAVIICFSRNILEAETLKSVFGTLSDAFFIPGALILCVGVLLLVSNEGLFNGIAYGLKTAGRSLTAKKGEKIKDEDFHEYNSRMLQKKHSIAHFIVIGLIFIAISMIFLMLYLS